MPADSHPVVPAELLAGWRQTDTTSETVFELSRVSVVSHTVVYEDQSLRETVQEGTGLDQMWRFFFATRLTFSPPLPPGIGPAAIFSRVASAADSEFRSILQQRGVRDIARGSRERIRVDTGDRARLRRYTATLDIEGVDGEDHALNTVGLLAVWTVDGEFRLAGGAYPRQSIAAVFDGDPALETDPDTFQQELLDLIQAVK